MLKFQDVVFYKSVSIDDQKVFFEERKEIVFVGRSNVGKSSIMNTLFSKKDMVKTSSKPWKTRLANIFFIDKKYYFTDLPGYGFAKMWKNLKEQLDTLISWYIEERRQYITKVVILIDSRLWPQDSDKAMFSYCSEMWVPMTIVLSKIDKLSKNDIGKVMQDTKNTFFWQQIFPVSSLSKNGIPELIKNLREALI